MHVRMRKYIIQLYYLKNTIIKICLIDFLEVNMNDENLEANI